RADRSQIQQVIMNLAINAGDAMPDGGRLKLETTDLVLYQEQPEQHPGVPPGLYVSVIARDTGHGMSEVTKERMFEPFFTTKEVGKGTGLGLAVVHGIVKQHSGHIVVDGLQGQGTTFRVYFPWTDAPLDPQSVRPTMRASLGAGETVLVVEDEEKV